MNIKLNKKESHLLEVFVPFLSLLGQYKLLAISLSSITLALVVIAKGRIAIYKECKPFMIFFAYIVFRDVLHMAFSSGADVSSQINRLIEYSVMYILIFAVCDKFNEDVLYKWWKIAGVIFGIGMIYHVIQLVILGNPVSPISIIPGYELRTDVFEKTMRPVSFFVEPASYVSAMMPLLFLAIKRKDLMWAFITTFVIVVSTSTVGVFLSAALWIMFVLHERKSIKSTVLIITLIASFVILFLNMGVFSHTLKKLELVVHGDSTFRSRIQAPLEVIGAMDILHISFGNNVLDAREFVLQNDSQFSSGSAAVIQAIQKNGIFLNSFSFLIYRYGIIGFIFFLMIFKGKILNKNYGARMYAIMLIIALFGQGNVEDPGINTILLLLYAIQSVSVRRNMKSRKTEAC